MIMLVSVRVWSRDRNRSRNHNLACLVPSPRGLTPQTAPAVAMSPTSALPGPVLPGISSRFLPRPCSPGTGTSLWVPHCPSFVPFTLSTLLQELLSLKSLYLGTSPVIQELRLCIPDAGAQVWPLVGGTRSYKLQLTHAATRVEDPECHNWDLGQTNK